MADLFLPSLSAISLQDSPAAYHSDAKRSSSADILVQPAAGMSGKTWDATQQDREPRCSQSRHSWENAMHRRWRRIRHDSGNRKFRRCLAKCGHRVDTKGRAIETHAARHAYYDARACVLSLSVLSRRTYNVTTVHTGCRLSLTKTCHFVVQTYLLLMHLGAVVAAGAGTGNRQKQT